MLHKLKRRVLQSSVLKTFSATASPVQQTLIASWELDESSGTRADNGPYGLTLTDNNTTPYGGSIISNARRCDGSTQYFTIPNASAYQLNGSSYTLMGWFFKEALATTGTLVAKRTAAGSADWEYVLYAHSLNKMQFLISGNATSTSSTVTGSDTFTAKSWNCAFAWYDSSGQVINCSLNGGSATSDVSTSGKTPTTNSANISYGAVKNAAGETYTNFLAGRLGAQAAFSGVLSGAERLELYNGGYQLRYDQLSTSLAAKVLWWVDFNQTSGNETDAKTGSTATALGTPTYRCGIYRTAQDSGSARFVIASSERLSRIGGTVNGLDAISSNFSIETACRFDATGLATQTTIVGKGATSDSIKGFWLNKNGTPRMQCTLGNGTSRISVIPTNTITAGVLYHVVVTFDRSGNMSMYINGSLGTGVGATSISGIAGDLGSTDLTIGGLSGSTFSECEIGFVRVYNYALSSTDVTYLYNSGSLRSYSNL